MCTTLLLAGHTGERSAHLRRLLGDRGHRVVNVTDPGRAVVEAADTSPI